MPTSSFRDVMLPYPTVSFEPTLQGLLFLACVRYACERILDGLALAFGPHSFDGLALSLYPSQVHGFSAFGIVAANGAMLYAGAWCWVFGRSLAEAAGNAFA